MKKLFFLLMMAFVMASTACAQKASGKKEEPVVVMNKQMFTEKVFDYTSGATEWKYLGYKPCIIDFYATWCGPCKMIAPILKELAEEYKDQIVIYKVDTDKEKELSMAMGIRSLPTVVFIPKDGQPQILVGAADKATFKRGIDEVLLAK
jgi:thioredoxin